MFDYVYQRSLSTNSKSIRVFSIFTVFYLSSLCFYSIDSQSIEKSSSQTLFKSRHISPTKKLLRIIYFREFDITVDENRLKNEVKNLTELNGIDLKIDIIDQSTTLSIPRFCSLISKEQRDTIIIADLYTKEIDIISRTLKIPTVATTNRYQIVQGKLHNPYLFKLMSDSVEEGQSLANALETRSVYTRIALIYDISPDMTEYRLSYLRLAKQYIIYRAHLPRISLLYNLPSRARKIITDLTKINIDLILCIMSTEREAQFIRLIKEYSTPSELDLLVNRTSWWFASRLNDIRNATYFPKIYTAKEDRRRLLSHFSSSIIKILFNAVIKTYIRLPISSLFIGTTDCAIHQNIYELKRTHMFIELFTNFTEWNCEIRVATGFDPLLFEPKTLAWRVPTIFMVYKEHSCQAMLFRLFYIVNNNAEQLFRSCRLLNNSSRRNSSSNQQDNSSTMALSSSNALVDIKSHHQIFGRLNSEEISDCRYVHIHTPIQTPIIVGVAEPPYIFVSDAQNSSEFHCNYGVPCYSIDPLLINFTHDVLFFHTKMTTPPHCCFGISIKLLLQIEDSNIVHALKKPKLFVFTDKPNKWLALTETLKNRRAHLSISPIPYESFLARSIDLSPPFYHSSYVILTVPPPSGPSLSAFLQPFSWATWGMIFFVLTMSALFETFFEWHSPYGLTPKGRRRQKVFSLASALTLGWSVIFSHTFKTKSPKCWSNRFLGNVWGGFGIVFIAIYTAKLASFMVETARTNTASNIQGIVNVCRNTPRCSIGVVANTSDEEYLKRFFTHTLYRHIKYVSSYGQGIDSLRSNDITYLLMDHSMARYYLTRDVYKLIRISDDHFGTFGLSLGFSKFDTDLKDNITNILLSYVDKGIIQRLHDDWYVYENCQTKLLDENGELSVDRFFGVFMLLIAGIFIGLIILVLEWMIFKYAVPYWRRRQWPGWMFCSQRLYAVLNVSDEIFNEAYCSPKDYSSRCVGERLHNYSTRHDSLNLGVVNVPKLLCTTNELKEQMNKITEEEQQEIPVIRRNGDLRSKQIIRKRIYELEQELTHLRTKLKTNSTVL